MITTIALFASILGAWLVADHNVKGYYIWLISNLLWSVDSVSRGDIQQTILWLYFVATCIIGIRKWKNKGENNG